MAEYETAPEVLARVLSMCKLDKSKPPIWEPYYPLKDSKYRNGWTCSCCGKHSFVKKEICEGCDSVMTNAKRKGGVQG